MALRTRPSVRTSVLLPSEQHLRLVEIAERNQVSVAWIIRQAVNQLLEKETVEQLRLPISLAGRDQDA